VPKLVKRQFPAQLSALIAAVAHHRRLILAPGRPRMSYS